MVKYWFFFQLDNIIILRRLQNTTANLFFGTTIFWNKNDQHFALKERSTPRHMDKVVYISLEYINIHLLYIMRVLIFMDPDKGCKRSFIWGRKGCAWETNAKNKKLSKLTYLTLLQYLTNNWLAITSCFSIIIYLYGQYLKFICSKIPRKTKQVWTFMNFYSSV